MSEESVAEDQERAREVYETLMNNVRVNTGGMQPPLARQTSIIAKACRAGNDPGSVHRAITAACSGDDLFRWRDERDGTVWLGLDDVDALRERIGTHAKLAEHPSEDIIGIANQRIAHLREDDSDE